MTDHPFVPYEIAREPESEMLRRGRAFHALMEGRRTVRDFSPDPVPRTLVELAISVASTAPSGAHRQPWKFVAIDDADLKQEIRTAAEKEEREFYEGRATDEWIEALRPLGTHWQKPFLTIAPWLVVVFEELYTVDATGAHHRNYYTKESVGIACGLFIAALHTMGLATLTHTPSPMKFLGRILHRPSNERPYILFPIGYPADGARVPDLTRKSLEQVSVWNPRSSEGAESSARPGRTPGR